MVSTGVFSSVGSPASTGPGTFWRSGPTPLATNASGIVVTSAIHKPQLEPAQVPSQSKQSGSCSAPMVIEPPVGTFWLDVLLVLLLLLLEFLLLEPHAASTNANATATTDTRTNGLRFNFTRPPQVYAGLGPESESSTFNDDGRSQDEVNIRRSGEFVSSYGRSTRKILARTAPGGRNAAATPRLVSRGRALGLAVSRGASTGGCS